MELPQPRPFGTQGSMSTHDFLSLYSPVQDPIPSHGNYLKTHDFLQPLEGKNSGKEENTVEITTAEKPPPPTPPPSDKHLILPGGMGTYSISHISYSNQRVPKPEGDIFAVAQASSSTEKNEENSNCSSYSGSGFTLWEESAMKKGKTRKENIAGDRHVTRGDLTEKVGAGKCTDQKPNTPRSKHSATEQRRRSKINDRFQMLRDLIPHSDQKRDKASFLLEVTEYIQYLQEKVHKYEGSYQEWNQEPELMPWRNSHKPTEDFVDQSRATNSGSGPPVMFAAKFEENNIDVSPTNAENGQNAVEYNMSTVTTLKAIDHHSRLTNMAVPHVPLMLNIFNPGGSGSAIAPFPDKMASDCAVASKNLKEQEMSIESGTISISSVYSQGLLNTLKQALQSSGVDLSQASISVQIDLRNPADSRPTASTSAVKDNEIPPRNPLMAHSGGASSGGESDRAQKRLKAS